MALDKINERWKRRLDRAGAGTCITVRGSNIGKIDRKFWKPEKPESRALNCSTAAKTASEQRLLLGVISAKLYGPKTKGRYASVEVKRRCGSSTKIIPNGTRVDPIIKKPRDRAARHHPSPRRGMRRPR